MDFELSEDQRAFRDTARQFATERMLPEAARWDAEKIFPVDALREAAKRGVPSLSAYQSSASTFDVMFITPL